MLIFLHHNYNILGENKDWEKHIYNKLPWWSQQTVNLLMEAKAANHPVYIVKFEDLKADTVREMKRVTDFLGFSYSEQEVSQRLEAGYSKFYRNHTTNYSHFTSEQEQYIRDAVTTTSQFMKDNGIYDMFPRIDEYL